MSYRFNTKLLTSFRLFFCENYIGKTERSKKRVMTNLSCFIPSNIKMLR